MKLKYFFTFLFLLFSFTNIYSQVILSLEGNSNTTICKGTGIQINTEVTPPNPNYTYNWRNLTTGEFLQSGNGDPASFIRLVLDQTSEIQIEVFGGPTPFVNTITITVIESPNPGTEGDLLLCNKTGTIDLFTVLEGNPDAGGSWSPALSGNNGNFVIGTDTPGIYTYSVTGTTPCSDIETTVTVRDCLDLDFDNDGVLNDVDLDDDNDGILDVVENALCALASLSETRPLVDIDFGEGGPTTNGKVLGHTYAPGWPDDGSYNVATSSYYLSTDNFVPYWVMTESNPIPNVDGSDNILGRYLSINVAPGYVNQPVFQINDIPIQIGTEYNFRIDMVGLCNASCAQAPILDLELIDQNLPAGSPPILTANSVALGVANDDIWKRLLLNFTATSTTFLTLRIVNLQPDGSNGNDLGIDNIRFAPLECDFDLDEIPNYLDLDSDNDGIYDLVEAGNPNVIDANNDGVADGPVDASGVPVSATGGSTPKNSDGAEFPDYLDIDADNDGIQDNIEGQSTTGYVIPSGNDINLNGVDDVYDFGNNPILPKDTDADTIPDYLDLNSDNDCLLDTIEAFDLDQDGIADIIPSGIDTDGDGLDNNYDNVILNTINSNLNPSDGNEIPTQLPDLHNPGNDVDFREEFIEIIEEVAIDICSGSTKTINLFNSLGDTALPNGIWTGPSVLTGGTLGTFNAATNTGGVYVYTLPTIGTCPARRGKVTVALGMNLDPGLDTALVLCKTDISLDLFDSLGGTPDTGGVWTPTLTSGTGVFDPAMDVAGTYTYTINETGCPPVSAKIVVTLNTPVNAGTNETLTICSSSTSIDLFTQLGGTPEAGGTWLPTLASGTGIFDPNMDIDGIYTYTVKGTATCPDATATVAITVINQPDAGTNQAITYCDSDAPVNLLTLLGGTPDTGGTWTPTLISGTNIYNPSTDGAGTYTYSFNTVGCTPVSANVVITVNSDVNAGINNTLNICNNDANVNLFSLLGGTPNTGGNWTPALASGTDIYNPAVDAGGIYTYTITSTFPCANKTAEIAVTLNNAPNAGTDAIVNICSLNTTTDLFAQLGGTPDNGGTWSPKLASGTGVFDPAIDASVLYTYTVTGTAPCVDATATVDVKNPLPVVILEDQYTLCINTDGTFNNEPTINTYLDETIYSFEWTYNGIVLAGETGASLMPTQSGTYSVVVTHIATQCISASISTNVEALEPPKLNYEILTTAFSDPNNFIVTVSNGAIGSVYEFSLDGGSWETANDNNGNSFTFENVTEGEHVVVVKDTNGCGENSIVVIIIDYPLFFTPNNDGYHDTWNISGLQDQPDAVIYIYDRFGKLLKQLSTTNSGWDGDYNGHAMPTSDYWFTVKYKNPQTTSNAVFKAHFTLKR